MEKKQRVQLWNTILCMMKFKKIPKLFDFQIFDLDAYSVVTCTRYMEFWDKPKKYST
jgi:hypothetical protein